MRRIGFIPHAGRPAAMQAARELVEGIRSMGVVGRELPTGPVGAEEQVDVAGFAEGLDLVVSVGGDGTFLRAAHVASRTGVPVLGVKVGRLGFLTEVEPGSALSLIKEFIEGEACVEDRLAVLAEPAGSASFEPQWGLNEVIVEKLARHRIVTLAVCVEEEYVTTFSADGVIVASPTGSTAYSFSARGPIVSPGVPCIIVTPIAAHMVFDRSFVLQASERVTLEVMGEEPGLLSADGRESLELPVGARVRIGVAPNPARLVRATCAPGFPALVRERFDLPGRPKTGPGGTG